MVIGHEDRAAAQTIGYLELVWISLSTFVPPKDQALPLATLGPQCIFRKLTVELLESAKIPYRIAANSPSLNGLWAALLGGLGITARTAVKLPEGLISAQSLYGLPALGQLPVTLHRSVKSEGVAIDRMAVLLSDSITFMLLAAHRRRSLHTDCWQQFSQRSLVRYPDFEKTIVSRPIAKI